MHSWAVVVPSNRPERLASFTNAWDDLFSKHNVNLIVVEDSPRGWEDIPAFVPRRTDMIRSWGFYKAYQTGANYIATLDDDVAPAGDVFAAYEQVFERAAPLSRYFSVGALTTSGVEMRGFPYADRLPRQVAIQYGGWIGSLDHDAATQLARPCTAGEFAPVAVPIPVGVACTGCIMNAAWQLDYTPIMWQLTLFEGRYDRVGDIWSGLFAKRVLDAIGCVMVINGKAAVRHDRASDAYANLRKEAPSAKLNDELWGVLEAEYSGGMIELYRQVTDRAIDYFGANDVAYANKFKADRDAWLGLW